MPPPQNTWQSFPGFDSSGSQQWRANMPSQNTWQSSSYTVGIPVAQSVPRQFGDFSRPVGDNTTRQPYSSTPMPQAHFTGYFGQGDVVTPTSVYGQRNGFSGSGQNGQRTGFSGYNQFGQFGIGDASSGSTYMGDSPPGVYPTAPQPPWFFDSGATNHITNSLHNITQPQPSHSSEGVLVGNGSTLQVTHTSAGSDAQYITKLIEDLKIRGPQNAGLVLEARKRQFCSLDLHLTSP
ncbi:hypothetical protein Vadar_014012 [Vaccinium darrowii]|uniref:Uncharacterized protein n=1 Tax=Vaccinium darrowii TaxID=229202 RepID=A0ACB7Z453_9ERIC|nr:hypothetical protein Vadar_014012 [Vaccinium darrowii]